MFFFGRGEGARVKICVGGGRGEGGLGAVGMGGGG